MKGKLFTKAGAITTLADARYFSSRMVDVVGFCFDRSSPDYISPTQVQEIIKWVEGPKIAGEFTGQSADEIMNIASILQLDILQWKGKMPDEKFLTIDLPKIICPEFVLQEDGSLNQLISKLNVGRDYLMLDEERMKSSSEFLPEIIPVMLNCTSNSFPYELRKINSARINFDVGKLIQSGEKSYEDFDALLESLQ